MPNYGLFTNFCVLQVLIQKGENFSKKEEKKKKQLQQSISRQSFVCRNKRLSKWLRKFVTIIFLMSQHKGLNLEEDLCHEKVSYVAIRN